MLTIRLQRTGTKNAASFRLVVAEKTMHVSKKVVEILGQYNPRSKDFSIKNPERLNYWLSHNTELSPTVNNLLVTKGLLKGDKVKAFNIPKKEVVAEAAASEAPAAESAPAEPAAEAQPSVTDVEPVTEEVPAETTPAPESAPEAEAAPAEAPSEETPAQ